MSVILAMHLGPFVMFATDTRTTIYDSTLTKIDRVVDGHKKLKAGPFGLMTGSGAVPLIDAVLDRVPAAHTVQDMLDIIRDENAAFWPTVPREQLDHPAGVTGFMISYLGSDGMRLGVYHPSWGHGFRSMEAGGGASFVPECPGEAALRSQVDEELQALLEAGIQPCAAGESVSASLRYHAMLMRSTMAEAHRRIPDTTSPDCLIGVHTETGQVMVTDYPLLEVAPRVRAAA